MESPVFNRLLGPAAGMTVLLCAAMISFSGCHKEPGKPVLVVYCSADQEYAEPILAEFQKKTGIQLQVRYDSEANKTVGLIQRLRAEKAQPVADVFWSNEVFHTIRLAQEGLLQPYRSNKLPACGAYCAGDACWHGMALRARAIAYNPQRVKAEQAPRRLEDLLAAKWKGRLAMAGPQFGTTGGDVASWFVHYGPEQARRILQGLADNKVRLADSNSAAVKLVATGQVDAALTDTDDVYAAQRNGWSVAMNLLDQDGQGALVIPNTVAIVRNGPHADLAGRLVEYLLSQAVEEALATSDAHNTPADPVLREKFKQYEIPHPLKIDYAKVSQAMPEALAAANEVLKP